MLWNCANSFFASEGLLGCHSDMIRGRATTPELEERRHFESLEGK
jgi:hypothetical protein